MMTLRISLTEFLSSPSGTDQYFESVVGKAILGRRLFRANDEEDAQEYVPRANYQSTATANGSEPSAFITGAQSGSTIQTARSPLGVATTAEGVFIDGIC